jgi:hypothetical protein
VKPRLLVVFAVLASLFVAVPFAQSASTKTFKSVATIKATKPVFHGRVHLRKAGKHPRIARPCRTHRRVSLFWRNPGGNIVKRVGVTRTNKRGGWSIRPNLHDGSYVAFAKKRVLRGGKVCGRTFSRAVKIG